MSRGKKLDLFVGAKIDEGWAKITEEKRSPIQKERAPKEHSLIFQKEKRRGKVVTLVGEFFLSSAAASSIVKNLKKKLGCGGTYKEGWMEFQGDIQAKVKENLQKEGFRFKS